MIRMASAHSIRNSEDYEIKESIVMRRIVSAAMLIAVIALGIGIGTITFAPSSNARLSTSVEVPAYQFSGTYEYETQDELLTMADAIFIGQVTNISPARWNQDSGAYWAEDGLTTLPYHEVQVAVGRTLVDTIGLSKQVTLTVLGGSPAGTIESAGVTIEPQAEHTLRIGYQGIFFVDQYAIAWRGGTVGNQATRPIIGLMGVPQFSYLTPQGDGLYYSGDPDTGPMSLAQLMTRITQQRRSQ